MIAQINEFSIFGEMLRAMGQTDRRTDSFPWTDNSPSYISPYPARLGLELGLRLWFG